MFWLAFPPSYGEGLMPSSCKYLSSAGREVGCCRRGAAHLRLQVLRAGPAFTAVYTVCV